MLRLLSLSALALFSGQAMALKFRLVDCGVWRGDTSIGYGLNDSRTVVGTSEIVAFKWNEATGPSGLGPLFRSRVQGTAFKINNSGVVCGWTGWIVEGYSAYPYPFVWNRQTGYKILPSPSGRIMGGQALGINEAAIVVGYFDDEEGQQAVLWDSAGAHKLGRLAPEYGSIANDVNILGEVVGIAGVQPLPGFPHGFYWSPLTGMVDLGTLPGTYQSDARAINNHGVIVGYSSGNAGAFGFRKRPGQEMENIGRGLEVTDVNDREEIVGAKYPGERAFLIEPGIGLVDLNDHVVQGPTGWTLAQAWSINSLGDIAGWGYVDGRYRAFLLQRLD